MSNITRHQAGAQVAGRKVGGRFAEKRRTEAAAFALQAERHGITVERAKELDEDMKHALNHFPRIVNGNWMNHREVLNSREDIRQEAAIELWKWARDHDKSGFEPEDVHRNGRVESVSQHGGMMRTLLKAQVTKVVNEGDHHYSGKGRAMLAKAKLNMESSLGRGLTKSEYEDLAEQVRLGFPAGRRPKIGYHLRRDFVENNHNFTEQDLPGYEDITGYLATEDHYSIFDDQDAVEDEVEDSAAVGWALDRISTGAGSPSAERKAVWSTFAQADPRLPTPTNVSSRSVSKKRVEAAPGGAHGVASRFLDGLSTPQEEEDFFKPFGGYDALTMDQRDAVAERIVKNPPSRAQKLWNVAFAPANQAGSHVSKSAE